MGKVSFLLAFILAATSVQCVAGCLPAEISVTRSTPPNCCHHNCPKPEQLPKQDACSAASLVSEEGAPSITLVGPAIALVQPAIAPIEVLPVSWFAPSALAHGSPPTQPSLTRTILRI